MQATKPLSPIASPVSYCIRVMGATMTPAIAPSAPLSTKASVLMVETSMPASWAANGLTAQARKARPI